MNNGRNIEISIKPHTLKIETICIQMLNFNELAIHKIKLKKNNLNVERNND